MGPVLLTSPPQPHAHIFLLAYPPVHIPLCVGIELWNQVVQTAGRPWAHHRTVYTQLSHTTRLQLLKQDGDTLN